MDNIGTSLQSLYEAKATSVEREDYDEAETIHKRIHLFKKTSINKRSKSIDSIHKNQKKELEEEFKGKMIEFNAYWDEREKDYDKQLSEHIEKLEVCHKYQIKQINDYYESKYQIKQSPSFLNMKRIQYELVKQECYPEANIMKKKADTMFKEENEKSRIQWNENIKKQINMLLKKQAIEKEIMKTKGINKQNLLKKEREKEHDNMLIRYSYQKADLEFKQKEEAKNDQKTMRKIIRNSSVIHSRNSLNGTLGRFKTMSSLQNV